MFRPVCAAILFASVFISSVRSTDAANYIAANVASSDIAYSSVTGLIYAAVPNSSASNPNTLTVINPNTAAVGQSIPIGFDPRRVAVSDDGNNLFVVIGGQRAVQRYNIPTASADQLFSISGGPQITELQTIPGRPNAVVLHEAIPLDSPPAISTVVYENGVPLAHTAGHGLGVGGPDIFAIDPTDGTKAYGYYNSLSSHDNVPMAIDAQGITVTGPTTSLTGILTGSTVTRIAIDGDLVFDNLGHIFSLSKGFQVAAFAGGSNFVLDPVQHELFSLVQFASSMQINAYSLDTLTLVGTDTIPNLSVSAGSLTRFGANGLAFVTGNNQVVFVHSAIVPEPSTIALASFGAIALLAYRRRRCVQL